MSREVLLPWERLLWSSRPWRLSRCLAGERYLLTDFRLLRIVRDAGARTRARRHRRDPAHGIPRRSPARRPRRSRSSRAAIGDAVRLTGGPPRRRSSPRCSNCWPAIRARRAMPDAVRAALAWEPRTPVARSARRARRLRRRADRDRRCSPSACTARRRAMTYAADDALAPNGEKREPGRDHRVHGNRGDAVGARDASAVSRAARSRHVRDLPRRRPPVARGWRMPAVAALPQPDVRDRGVGKLSNEHRRTNA